MPKLTIAGLGKRGIVEFENHETLFDAVTKFCQINQMGPPYQYGLR